MFATDRTRLGGELPRRVKGKELLAARRYGPEGIDSPDVGQRHAIVESRRVDHGAVGVDVAVLHDDADTLVLDGDGEMEHAQPETLRGDTSLLLAHAAGEPWLGQRQHADTGLAGDLFRQLAREV